MEDADRDPESEDAGSPLHRETTVDETAQLTLDMPDVDDGSMPSVLYIFRSDRASFCTVVAAVDAADGDRVTAVVAAVDIGRRLDAFLSGEHTGQSARTQFFQCAIICRKREQCCTEDRHSNWVICQFHDTHARTQQYQLYCHFSGSSRSDGGPKISKTRSSAVAGRPHDTSCMSVINCNSTIPRAKSFIPYWLTPVLRLQIYQFVQQHSVLFNAPVD